MKIRLSQLRSIIKEEVQKVTQGMGNLGGDGRLTNTGRGFYATSLRPGTSWVTSVPFVALDESNINDTDRLTFAPLNKAGIGSNASRAVGNFAPGTMFTVVDDNFGVDSKPNPYGDIPQGQNYVLVEVDGEEYILAFSTKSMHVKPAG